MQMYRKETDATEKQNHFAKAKGFAMTLFGLPHGAKFVLSEHVGTMCKPLEEKGQKLDEESKAATGKEALKKKRESEHLLEITKFLRATARILETMSNDLSLLDKLMMKGPESVIPLAREVVVMLRCLGSFFRDGNDLDSIIRIVTEFATFGLEGTYLMSLPLSVAMSGAPEFDIANIIDSTDFLDKSLCKYLKVN
jgi:hypothetical protein